MNTLYFSIFTAFILFTNIINSWATPTCLEMLGGVSIPSFEQGDEYIVANFSRIPIPLGVSIDPPSPISEKPTVFRSSIFVNRENYMGQTVSLLIKELPPVITKPKGIFYYGRTIENPNEVRKQTKDLFEKGRRGDGSGHFNLTWYTSVRGFREKGFSGFFSTTTNFKTAQYFATHHDNSKIGVVYVIDGKEAAGIDVVKLHKYLLDDAPENIKDNYYLFSGNQIEAEVAFIEIDPRQIQGAWIQRSVEGQSLPDGHYIAKYRTYDFVKNPNYDPLWSPQNSWGQ